MTTYPATAYPVQMARRLDYARTYLNEVRARYMPTIELLREECKRLAKSANAWFIMSRGVDAIDRSKQARELSARGEADIMAMRWIESCINEMLGEIESARQSVFSALALKRAYRNISMRLATEYGVPIGNVKVVCGNSEDGVIHVYWGGYRSPDGLGHGHLVFDIASREVVMCRPPFTTRPVA